MKQTKERLDYIDAIRAIAACGVVYLHADLALSAFSKGFDFTVLHFFVSWFDPGKFGVLVLFMVSGFVIPFSFSENGTRGIVLKKFLLARFFRLYPIYWLSMIAAFFVLYGASFSVCTPRSIIANATMFQKYFGIQDIIGVYWTLQIEWAFYILCMILFWGRILFRQGTALWVYLACLSIGMAMAAIRFHTHKALPVALPMGLSLMLLAMLWRNFLFLRTRHSLLELRIAVAIFLSAIWPICFMAYSFDAGHNENWYRYTIVYISAVCAFMLLTTRLKIRWRPLVFTGKASYSLYLFADISNTIFDRIFPPQKYAAVVNVYIVVELLFAIVLAVGLYYAVEKSFIALGRRAISKLNLYPLGETTLTGSGVIKAAP
jgi:peptidoglycan/LPS O-acetylase OafA/YrhL